MFGTAIKDSEVHNTNDRVFNSGNTNTNSFSVNSGVIDVNISNASTLHDSGAFHSAPVHFQPGDFRVLANLPFHRNSKFCGRSDIIDKLYGILKPYQIAKPSTNALMNTPETVPDVRIKTERKTAVLYGLSGIGKSQIALEYAHHFSDCYSCVLWIDAGDSSHTISSACNIVEQLVEHYVMMRQPPFNYREITNILNIPRKINTSGKIDQGTTQLAIKALRHWLSRSGNHKWLLLVDNYDRADLEELHELIPTCNWGSVIITSRFSGLATFGKPVNVEEIGVKEGLELLLQSSEKDQQGQDKIKNGFFDDHISNVHIMKKSLRVLFSSSRSVQLNKYKT